MVSRQKKEGQVAGLKERLAEASIIVIADYRGLNNMDLTALRRALRDNDARLVIAKNTLVRRAVEGTAMDALFPDLKGPTALLLGGGDQVGAVKAVRDFLKKNKKKNELRAAFLEGSHLDVKGIEELADLPPIEQLRGKLLMCIAYPMMRLVQTIQGPSSALVRGLSQLAEQKQAVG